MPLNRRDLLKSAATGLAVGVARGANAKPNIVWLIGEDLCPDLGCYGNRAIATPNLDRLASEGMRFDNAYVTNPICSPSRSAILTGMWQIAIDAQHHRSHRSDGYMLPEGVLPFTHYLREAGYHTSNVVKPAEGVRGTGKTDFNFTLAQPAYDGTDWSQRKPGQPFYAQVNFNEAHRVWKRDTQNPVDPATITPPPYYPNTAAVREDFAMYYDSIQQLDAKVGKVLARLERENLLENTIVVFFGDNGRAMPRGKEYLYEGGIHTPFLVRVPKSMQVEGAGHGVARKDLISCIDLTVTTLQLAGARVPANMHGIPFLGPKRKTREYVFAARDRGDETPDRIRAIRDARYKYIRNFRPEIPYTADNADRDVEIPTLAVMRQMHAKGQLSELQSRFMAARKPEEELFDLEKDPYETVNLAVDKKHAPVLARLRRELERWIQETGDTGARPEKRSAMQRPNEIEFRTQVDGWCTQNYSDCVLSRTVGTMKVHCGGKVNLVRRSYVCEGGNLRISFAARSSTAPIKTFSWGSITDFDNPANRKQVDFVADGKTHEYSVDFSVKGHLAKLVFDFEAAEGETVLEWIRLYKDGSLEKEWMFRPAR